MGIMFSQQAEAALQDLVSALKHPKSKNWFSKSLHDEDVFSIIWTIYNKFSNVFFLISLRRTETSMTDDNGSTEKVHAESQVKAASEKQPQNSLERQ